MKLSFWIWTRVPKDLWFWTWDFPSPSEVIESRADCFGTPSWGKRFPPWDCWARSWFGSWWWKLTCIFRSIKWVGWFSGCGFRSICWFTRSFPTRFAGSRGFTRTSSSRMRTFWTKVTWYCLKVFLYCPITSLWLNPYKKWFSYGLQFKLSGSGWCCSDSEFMCFS